MSEIIPDDAFRPTMPDDAWSLREYLQTLRVGPIRELAANGMPSRHESTKAEMIEWLVRNVPASVRLHREEAGTTVRRRPFIVQITRTETIAFQVDADDADDARDRYLIDGEEVASSTTDTTIDAVDEGTATEILG